MSEPDQLALPDTPVYKSILTPDGRRLRFTTTLKAIHSCYRRPECKLITNIRKTITGIRLSPKTNTSNPDQDRYYMTILAEVFTNYHRLTLCIIVFDINVAVGPISTLLKTCPALVELVFNRSQVTHMNMFQLGDSPGLVLPLDHNLKKVTFNKVSFPHSLRFLRALQETASEEANTVFHLVNPVITEADVPEIQKFATSFEQDKWDYNIKFDLVKLAAQVARSNQHKRVLISNRIQAIVSSLRSHMGVVAARNVEKRSGNELLATIMKQGPAPPFEIMRDYEQHEAILKEPVDAVRLLTGGQLPPFNAPGEMPAQGKKPAAPKGKQSGTWEREAEKEYNILVKNSMYSELASPQAAPVEAKASKSTAEAIKKRAKTFNEKPAKKTKN